MEEMEKSEFCLSREKIESLGLYDEIMKDVKREVETRVADPLTLKESKFRDEIRAQMIEDGSLRRAKEKLIDRLRNSKYNLNTKEIENLVLDVFLSSS